MDGDVSADSLEELFKVRAAYLNKGYDADEGFYKNSVEPEFKKIMNLPENSVINLWFEDDLFCQVNLWFVCSLIEEFGTSKKVFLIRPHTNLQYGFGGLNSDGLINAFESRVQLSDHDISLIASLWTLYQQNNHSKILKLATKNSEKFPFLVEAAKANLERFPSNGSLGRPEKTLLHIMKEIGSNEFGPVFREFHKRESIYGFGDLQVKRMFDQLKTS